MSFFRGCVCGLSTAVIVLLAGCQKPKQEIDYFSWTNPVTAAVVKLPEGWRQSPRLARQGETTVGYFSPTYAQLFGRYGHVTLHHEDLRQSARPMTLGQFVANFADYLRFRATSLSTPIFETEEGFESARLSAEIANQGRSLLLEIYVWTVDGLDFWYAVAESSTENPQFAEQAAPLIELLRRSTLIAP